MQTHLKTAIVAALVGATTATATAAVAGSGVGGIFNLGKTNAVNAPSALTGFTAGNQLAVANTSAAAASRAIYGYGQNATAAANVLQNAGGGSALSLLVNAGKAPFTTNSATKVANLNADQLDGLDQSSFLRTTGKAADSAKLGGLDQSAFLRTTGKAADANLIDGLDSGAFAQSVGGATKILSNRLVLPPDSAPRVLLVLPGLGTLYAWCYPAHALVSFINFSGSTLDVWENSQTGGERYRGSFLAAGKGYAVTEAYPSGAFEGGQYGGGFAVGLGDQSGGRLTASGHTYLFEATANAYCGIQATVLWSSS